MVSNIINDSKNERSTSTSASFQWYDIRKAVEQTPKPLDFVIPGLKHGSVGAIVAPGAAGKTMFALQAAVTVAGGPDLLEFSKISADWTQKDGARVVYLTAEDPGDVLDQRFHAIGKHLSPDSRETVYKNLNIAPLYGYNVDIMRPEWQRWIESVTYGARLVIFDTLRRFHSLEENDGGQMKDLLGYMEHLCRINSTTVLFLHHTSKSGALMGGDAQQASRGSSVLIDNARFQENLVSMTPGQASTYDVHEDCRKSFVRVVFSKINYCAPLPDKWYRKTEGGVLLPAVLEEKSKSKSVKTKTKHTQQQQQGGGQDEEEIW